MAIGMWCDSLVMRVPIGEPQTTAPSPGSLKLAAVAFGAVAKLCRTSLVDIFFARAPECSCAANPLERDVGDSWIGASLSPIPD
jgi:hypothetical protein